MSEEQAYDLIFEGPSDDSAATLARIKSAFIAELEFSIPQVQEFLTKVPVTLRSAQNPAELEPVKRVLARAGANVSVLRRVNEEDEEPGSLELNIKLEDIGISEDDEEFAAPKSENVYVLPDAEDPDHSKPKADLPKGKNAEELMQSLMALHNPASGGVISQAASSADSVEATPPSAPPSAESMQAVLSALSLDEPEPRSEPTAVEPPQPALPETRIIEDLSLSLESAEQLIAAPPAPSAPAPAAPPAGAAVGAALSLSLDGAQAAPAVGPSPAAPSAQPAPPSPMRLDSLKVNLTTDTGSGPIEKLVPTEEDDGGLDLVMSVQELTSGRVDLPPVTPEVPPQLETALEAELTTDTAVAPPAPASQPEKVMPSLQSPVSLRESIKGPPKQELAPAATEPIAEAEIEEESPPKKRGLPLDTIAVVLVAGTLLLVANWFYFAQEDLPLPTAPTVKAVAAAPQPESAAPVSATAAPVAETKPAEPDAPPALYSGTATEQGVRVQGILAGRIGTVLSGNFIIETDPPPALTNEEIVRRVIRQPWVVKVELENLRFERDRSGSFIARAPAKVYIDYKDERIRIMGAALVRTSFPVSDKRALVYLEVSHLTQISEFTNEEPITSVSVAPSDDGLFTFGVTARFALPLEQMPTP